LIPHQCRVQSTAWSLRNQQTILLLPSLAQEPPLRLSGTTLKIIKEQLARTDDDVYFIAGFVITIVDGKLHSKSSLASQRFLKYGLIPAFLPALDG
jgi:hypothetical protein